MPRRYRAISRESVTESAETVPKARLIRGQEERVESTRQADEASYLADGESVPSTYG
jgi:hypothetical protein